MTEVISLALLSLPPLIFLKSSFWEKDLELPFSSLNWRLLLTRQILCKPNSLSFLTRKSEKNHESIRMWDAGIALIALLHILMRTSGFFLQAKSLRLAPVVLLSMLLVLAFWMRFFSLLEAIRWLNKGT